MSTWGAGERMDLERLELERRLTDWLAGEGPQDVPDRVVDAAVARARTVRRLRPWPAFVTRLFEPAFAFGHGHGASMTLRPSLVRAWAMLLATVLVALAATLLGVGALLVSEPAAKQNGEIAFDAGGDIWLVDPASSAAPRNLTATPDIEEGNPVWSPDGRLLAYWVTRAANGEIQVVDEQRGHVRTLIAPPDILLPPSASIFGWSPDGGEIAVPARGNIVEGGLTRAGVEMVVVFDVETGEGRRLETDVEGPSFGWSPDGRLIGLVGDYTLHVAPSDGGSSRMLSNRWRSGSFLDSDPRWLNVTWPSFTPDGRSILYAAEVALPPWQEGDGPPLADPTKMRHDGDIFMATTDGLADPVTLLGGPTNDVAPRLSPDGRHLAFGRSSSVTMTRAFAVPWVPLTPRKQVDLYVVEAAALEGGSVRGTIVPLAEHVWPDVVWAPDGRQLVTKSATWDELLIIDRERPDSIVRIRVGGEGALIWGYSWRPMPP